MYNMGTRKGQKRTGAVRGARLAFDAVPKKGKPKMSWINAVKKARKTLGVTGFVAIKKGTPLYKKAKSLM